MTDLRDLGELDRRVEALRRLESPEQRAATATALLERLADVEREVSAIRDAAVRHLRAGGQSYGSIAAAVGLTRSRVVQLVQRTDGLADGLSGDPAAP